MVGGVSSGIRRKVDDLGRVVIPAGIRRALNIREGDAVEVSVDGERVVLSKPRDACVFCGREDEGLHPFRGRLLCRECVTTIGQVDERLRATGSAAARDSAGDAAGIVTPAPPTGPVGGDAPRTLVPPTPTATPTASGHVATGPAAPIPAEVADGGSPPRRPSSWPAGPIDGDAFARDQARAAAETAPGNRQPPQDEATEPSPPPYDPASTTAW